MAGKNAAAYSSAKAAELHLARCLAEEGGADGIRVNTVNPDAVLQGSRIWDSSWREERAAAYGIAPDELEEHYRKRTTLGVNILPGGHRRRRPALRLVRALGQEHRQRAQRRRRRAGRVPALDRPLARQLTSWNLEPLPGPEANDVLALFIARRILVAILLLIIVSFIIFGLLALAPGSPERLLLGRRPPDPAVIKEIRAEYHLNDPFLKQYWLWLTAAVFHLDFGRSIYTSQPVTATIESRIPMSFFLGIYGFIGTMVVNLAVVRQIVDRVYVLCKGEIVEEGQVGRVLDQPQHLYTVKLVDSIPRSDAAWLGNDAAAS